MRRGCRTTPQFPIHHGQRCPAETAGHGSRVCRVFSLSLLDVELVLAERSVLVTNERAAATLGGWPDFRPQAAERAVARAAARPSPRRPGNGGGRRRG